MPSKLPNASEVERQLAKRDAGEGFDTEVARFFDTIGEEDAIPTEIDGGELGKTARKRSQKRAAAAWTRPLR